MERAVQMAILAALVSCKPTGSRPARHEPTGTPSDPVDVCKRLADVCRLDASRLGVCVQAPAPDAPACAGRTPCYVCTPQH
jgi:hypothetical protein